MNPTNPPTSPLKTSVPTPNKPVSVKKKSANLDLKMALSKTRKYSQKLIGHLPFIAVMLVLLLYIFIVWQIRGLVIAEPSPEDESAALSSTKIPKIDKAAIDHIQSLEQNSPAVRSLFNEARNNPFQE